LKVALVTTPPSIRSGIGDYTRHLLPYLREHCDVHVYVEQPDGDDWDSEPVRSVADLNPKEYDQVLYQLGNEGSHAFMLPMIRAIGGTVMQHDWVLFDLAMQAWPGLMRGGAKGHALALREGGFQQASLYSQNWLDRRRQRTRPVPRVEPGGLVGTLLTGWYDAEDAGRWTSDFASFRIPARGVTEVEVELHVDHGRTVLLLEGEHVHASRSSGPLTAAPRGEDHPVLTLETRGITVTKEQRKHGDARRMGAFVHRIRWKDAAGEHDLDLQVAAAVPNAPVSLSRDRFRLPLNRSVVRFADAFIVHSRYVRDLIVAERNAVTPIGIVHHGAERRWRTTDRVDTRRALGLSNEWIGSFLVVSFGGVQPHKRVDKAIHALARAREQRDDIRLILAGSLNHGDFDPQAMVRGLGLEGAVRFTGFLPEEEAWEWLHAGDIGLNLRGPTSGGTSGGIFQSFSMGRSVIASDAAEQSELPESAVVKIPLGSTEVEDLARAYVELRDDPKRRAALEVGVREFVDNECHWSLCAQRYFECLEAFPRPRVSRKSIIAMRLAMKRSAL